MKKITVLHIALTLVIVLLAACGQRQNSQQSQHDADSIFSLAKFTGEAEAAQALQVIDSTEQAGGFSENTANAYRAHIYFDRQQYRMAEYYGAKALKDSLLRNENRDLYYQTCEYMISTAFDNGDQKRGLELATAGRNEARLDPTDNGRLHEAKFLSKIALGQIRIGRREEGLKSAEECFSLFEDALRNRSDFSERYMWYSSVGEIIQHFAVYDTELSKQWLPRLDQTFEYATQAANTPPDMLDYCRSKLHLTKAEIYAKAGQQTEARQQFLAYQQTNIARSGEDWLSPLNYYESMQQWKNAHDIYLRWDQLCESEHIPYNKEQEQILLMRFHAEQMMHAPEWALKTAERIVMNRETVDSLTRSEDAAQLAVIYETQEKEYMINEQASALSQQRIIAVVIALALALIFLAVFMVFRHRAAKKLEEKNRELERTNAELTVANARAEESSRMKTNFIQQISHEIRTPLNILSGFTQVVTTPGMTLDDATKQDINQRIKENTDRITGLVNKMLELSDASSQSVIELTDDVTPLQIATEAVAHAGIEQATHIAFDLQTDAEAGENPLHTNQQYAVRALTLLLDNALKFTKDGRVTLTLRTESGRVVFCVEDTGIGIPAAEAEHIFDEFVQLDEYYEGTGIGLTVARSIARRLGGDITLDTSYTGGARFLLFIPHHPH